MTKLHDAAKAAYLAANPGKDWDALTIPQMVDWEEKVGEAALEANANAEYVPSEEDNEPKADNGEVSDDEQGDGTGDDTQGHCGDDTKSGCGGCDAGTSDTQSGADETADTDADTVDETVEDTGSDTTADTGTDSQGGTDTTADAGTDTQSGSDSDTLNESGAGDDGADTSVSGDAPALDTAKKGIFDKIKDAVTGN